LALVARIGGHGLDVPDRPPRLLAEPDAAWYGAGVPDDPIAGKGQDVHASVRVRRVLVRETVTEGSVPEPPENHPGLIVDVGALDHLDLHDDTVRRSPSLSGPAPAR
jgi:hypothetical protein